MALGDRLRAAFFGFGSRPATAAPAAETKAGKARDSYAVGSGGGSVVGVLSPRPGARTLRTFSERNVWVRIAINRRKREIGRASWTIARVDNPKAPPDEKLVTTITELFRFINAKRESLRSLLDMLVEDILVLDAGCCEKVKTAGGKIYELRAVDGATIAPNGKWDGDEPHAPRYYQIIDGKTVASFTNDELIYMMANQRTNSAVGWSPLETLFETVRADLYGESFEYQSMRQTAPAGMMYLGSGVPPEKVEEFRDHWEQEIAGTRDIVFLGGGVDPMTGEAALPPAWTAFTRSARDEERRAYMKWLATKVAGAFEMDLLAFNLSEAVHKSVGDTMQAKSDIGLLGLAGTIEEFITREIIWEMDPLHRHGFRFTDLTPREAIQIAKLRQIYMNIGCTTPNEIRAEDGLDPVPWGDEPWPTAMAKATDPAQEATEAGSSGDENAPPDDDPQAKPKAEPDDDDADDDDNGDG